MNRNKIAMILTLSCIGATAYAFPPERMMERIMDKMDVDGDGMISAEEFTPPVGRMLDRVDTNEDGAISEAELREQHAKMLEKAQQRHEKMLAQFAASDVDGNGLVTEEEARLGAFTRADTDGDGFLNAEELAEARPKKRRHGPRGRHHEAETSEPI